MHQWSVAVLSRPNLLREHPGWLTFAEAHEVEQVREDSLEEGCQGFVAGGGQVRTQVHLRIRGYTQVKQHDSGLPAPQR